ncbi:MAG: ThuA domain-containing protein [Acidobacteria bacterium]|nr:ThuA domain-containing protein [Acidobacteriota bacterium]
MRAIALLAAAVCLTAAEPLRVRLVTGGHSHDPEFYSVFMGDPRIKVTVEPHPNAYRGSRDRIDVLVLYDMIKAAGAPAREWLRAWVESGKGLVVLHHAICSFEDWEWWGDEVVGARYLNSPSRGMPPSTFFHDLELDIQVVKKHPVTAGVDNFHILDETYKGMWFAPKLELLLTTKHEKGDGPIGWIGPSKNARVVVLQGGHDKNAHLHASWQRLVRNAILWAGNR